MNVIAQLEFELAYYNSTVDRFNHYTTRTIRLWGSLGNLEDTFIAIAPWSTLTWLVVPVRVPSMSQIELLIIYYTWNRLTIWYMLNWTISIT